MKVDGSAVHGVHRLGAEYERECSGNGIVDNNFYYEQEMLDNSAGEFSSIGYLTFTIKL